MRGFPLLQSIVVVLAVILAGVPVYRLTRPARADAAVVSAIAPSTGDASSAAMQITALDVEAVFAPAPADFEVKNLDQIVLAGRGPKAHFTARWTGSVPPEGVDLVVQAHWPVASSDSGVAPAAAKFTVQFSDGRRVEKSFWADATGTLTDVLALPGASGPP